MEEVRARTQASRDDDEQARGQLRLRQWKAMAEAAASRRQQEERAAAEAERIRLQREAITREEEARENRRFASDKATLALRGPKPDEAAAAGECAVCLEEFKEGDTLRMTPCSHCFHIRCIYGWLRASGVCPYCCLELPSEDEREEEAEVQANDGKE